MSDPTYKKIGEYSGLAEVTDSTLLLASLGGSTYSVEAETVMAYVLAGIEIDSTPTQGSDNAVSSGGTYTAIAAVDAKTATDSTLTQANKPAEAQAVGTAIQAARAYTKMASGVGLVSENMVKAFSQGTVDPNIGSTTSSNYAIRTGRNVQAADFVRITCDDSHEISLFAYLRTSYKGYVEPQTGELVKDSGSTTQWVKDIWLGDIPRDYMFILVMRNAGGTGTIAPSASYTLTGYRLTDASLATPNIPADAWATGRTIGYFRVLMAQWAYKTRYINADNTIAVGSMSGGNNSHEVTRDSAWSEVFIVADADQDGYVTFLTGTTETLTSGDSISGILATGETGRRTIPAGTGVLLTLPDDCTVINFNGADAELQDHTIDRLDGIIPDGVAQYASDITQAAIAEEDTKIGCKEIDISTGTLISGKAIRDNNTIISNSQMATTEITRDAAWKAIMVEANTSYATLVTFLTGSIANVSGGDSISGILATGETGRRGIEAGDSKRFVLPEDCTVIAITTKSSNHNHTPAYLAGVNSRSAAWYAESIPAAAIPAPPSTNGTYVLKATVSSGTVTYSWVAG